VTCENKQDFPYIIGNSSIIQSEKPGIVLEYMKLLEKELNIKFRFTRNPWKRCFYLLGNNDSDALIYASYNSSRKKYGVYPMKNGKIDNTLSIVDISYSLYSKKGSKIMWDGNRISNLTEKIGAPSGYSIVSDLIEKGYQVDESPSTVIDLKKLLINRLSAVAALEMTADYYIENNKDFADKIIKHEPELAIKPYFMLFSSQFYNCNPELTKKIWVGLAKLRNSKNITILMKKYIRKHP
ncbi:transporter substrate-binding domain-containing protein, partial [bacterium]|nr:transporter substrate-binding domain-containing protein [bacterium]